jgi:hypothetical protein
MKTQNDHRRFDDVFPHLFAGLACLPSPAPADEAVFGSAVRCLYKATTLRHRTARPNDDNPVRKWLSRLTTMSLMESKVLLEGVNENTALAHVRRT